MKRENGFTLAELLTAVCVVLTATALLLPAMGRSAEVHESARCAMNLKACGQALIIYANDHADWIMGNALPAGHVADRSRRSWGGLLASLGYLEAEISGGSTALRGENVLRCPSAEYREDIFSTYGMRTTYHSDFAGIKGDTPTRPVNLADVPGHASKIWLADSLDGRSGTQTNHFDGGFNWGKGGHTSVHLVHTRHEGRANAWFLDGRVEACLPYQLYTYNYGNPVFYYDGDVVRIRF